MLLSKFATGSSNQVSVGLLHPKERLCSCLPSFVLHTSEIFWIFPSIFAVLINEVRDAVRPALPQRGLGGMGFWEHWNEESG